MFGLYGMSVLHLFNFIVTKASGSTARKKRRVHPELEDDDGHVEELGPSHLEESSKCRPSFNGKYPVHTVRIVYEVKSRPVWEEDQDGDNKEEICQPHLGESSDLRDMSGSNQQTRKSSRKVVNLSILHINWLILSSNRHHHRQNPPWTRPELQWIHWD